MNRYLIIIFLMLMIAGSAFGQNKYKSYQTKSYDENFFSVVLKDKSITLEFYDDIQNARINFKNEDINLSSSAILVRSDTLIVDSSIMFQAKRYNLNDIYKIEIDAGEKETRVLFTRKSKSNVSKFKTKKRNKIGIISDMTVNPGDFVRGSVVSFWGNISVNGEVNEDIVALYGDISIGAGAVIRGDVIAINGRVDIEKDAVIYGEIQSSSLQKEYSYERRRRWMRRDKTINAYGKFIYNRVDGAAPYLGLKFVDEDTLLPEILAYIGYGFASEKFRYNLSLEQPLFRDKRLTLNGAYYRRLASDDDRILSDNHNTFFALTSTEDYKDFYEAEGGAFFIKYRPINEVSLNAGFTVENHRWLPSHPELWSLFGGSKQFPDNFASLDSSYKANGIAGFDNKDMKAIHLKTLWLTSRFGESFDESYWKAQFDFELAPSGWNDDFDFSKYRFSAGRYQKLNKNFGLLGKISYGSSDGVLPIHRLYYLGGINSLSGYDHKEYFGSEFWLANLEQRFSFNKTDFNLWLFYNAGQIDGPMGKLSDAEVKQSLGVGLSYGDNIRLDLARRLDRADDNFAFHVRLGFNL